MLAIAQHLHAIEEDMCPSCNVVTFSSRT